ncbi:cytochrome [Sesamum alatum]|uniref:Cytochrome n=1 Tax=Sesamum alatum TaxID=300844 RepID=A0AAE1XJK6_9LAMI|nr:cytochrome [Sesamum alatum]
MAEVREYVIFLILWLISTILIGAFFKKRSSPRLPPGPPALPIIGHLHLLGPKPHQSFAKLSSRYGPLVHLYLGSVPCVVASSPEICKELLKTCESSFLDRPQTVVTHDVTYGNKDFTFAPYGDYWRFVKKLFMSQLLGGQTLDLLQPVRRDEVKCLIDFLLVKANAGESVDMGSEFTRMANNLISRMVMSRRCSEDEKDAGEVRKLVQDITELTGKFNVSDYIRFCKNLDLQGIRKRLKVLHDRLDRMIEKIIDEHEDERRELKQRSKEGEVGKDLLHILLDTAEDESSEMKLTRENIKAFIVSLNHRCNPRIFDFLAHLAYSHHSTPSNIKRSSPHLPPRPLALAIIGHLHPLGPLPPHQEFATILSRYGPLVHLYLGSVPCILASSDAIGKEFVIKLAHVPSLLFRPSPLAPLLLTGWLGPSLFGPLDPHPAH